MNRWLAWTLVALQFVLLIALAVVPGGNLWSRSTGVLIGVGALALTAVAIGIAAGLRLGKNLTPSPIPREQGTLETSGLYRVVRHPIYTALLLGGAALAAWGSSWVHLVLYLLLVMLLGIKARAEERLLLARFPEYREYQSRTGRFFPGVGRVRGR